MSKRQYGRSFLRWLTLAAWGLTVLLLTTLPGDTPVVKTLMRLLGNTEFGAVMGHMGLFTLLTILLYTALCQWLRVHVALLVAMCFVLLLGTTTELFQWFVDGRNTTIADLMANWLGVFIAGFTIEHLLLIRGYRFRR